MKTHVWMGWEGWCVGSKQQCGGEVKGHGMMVTFGLELEWFVASMGKCICYVRVAYGEVDILFDPIDMWRSCLSQWVGTSSL